jgi:type II secretory pathway component PulC
MKKFLTLLFLFVILIVAHYAVAEQRPHGPAPYKKGSFPERPSRDEIFRMHVGIAFAELDEGTKKQSGIKSGVVITKVVGQSPAEDAGLKVGDIILEFDGREVIDVMEMRHILQGLKEPRPVLIKIVRDGKTLTHSLIPEKNYKNKDDIEPDDEKGKKDQSRSQETVTRNLTSPKKIGAQVSEIDQNMASYFQVKAHSGLLITEIEANGPADAAGLKTGDIITIVNGQSVQSRKEMQVILDELKTNEPAEIKLIRHGKEAKFSLTPEKFQADAQTPRPAGTRAQEGDQDRERQRQLRQQILEKYQEELKQLREEMESGTDREEAAEKMRQLREKMRLEMQKLQKEGVESEKKKEPEEEVVN